MIEEGQEYTTPEYDDDGNLIETLGEYDVFIEDEIPEEDHDDSYYQAEEGDLAELDYAEEDNVDPIESKILESQERYEMARDAVIERLTAILEKGEISSEDNADLNDVLHDYTDSVNDIKDKITEDTQGNNDTSADNEINTAYVLPEELQHLVDLLNNGGRNDLLFIDEEGRVLVEGEQIPKLKLVELEVEKLVADYAEITELVAGKATIEDLNAVKAKIGTLEVGEVIADTIHANKGNIAQLDADLGKIETLVGGNLTMDNIQSLILSSQKVTVENAFIKDAMIDTISANKLNTGSINTNLVNIQSNDGSLLLNGTLQQFKDENGKVRIQMGKDAQGNFTFGLFDSTGTGTLIDSNGIKEKAIGDGLIVDKMVGDNANISGSKLDINSVVTEVNNGTNTIKSNKILFDDKKQTLDIAFSQMDSKVTTQGQTIGTHTTQIQVAQSNIQTLISETNIIEDGNKVTVKDAYNKLNLKVNEFGVSLKDVESDFRNMEIGGSNILDNADFKNDYTGWVKSHNCNHYIITSGSFSNLNDKAMKVEITANQTYAMMTQTHTLVPNQKYTVSCYMLLDGTFNLAKAGIRLYYVNNGWNVINAYSFITTEQLGKWTKLSVTFTPNSTYPETVITFGLQGIANQFCYVTIPQLEKGTIATDFKVKSADITSSLNTLGTRVKEAETKLTLDGLTTIIGSTYITPTQLNNKGYATTSDVTQSVNGWTAKFMESGGYNKLYNGDFRRGLELWSKGGNIDSVISTTLSCPDNMYGIDMPGQIGKTAYYSQEFAYDRIGKLTLSYWTYITTSGVSGTTNPYSNIQIVVYYTDGTTGYLSSKTPTTTNTWEKISFTVNLTKRPNKIKVELINRDTTKRLYFTNIMLEDGEIANAFTPNPNEVFDGETNISKYGVKVTQSNYNGYTNMRADGFYLNDGKEDVIKCTSTGLEVIGKVTVTSGSISESALAGTLIDGQYIKTDTIKARSIQIGDFTNYFTTPTNYTTNAKYPAYAMNSGTGQIFVTNKIAEFGGGEKFLVTGFVYAPATNGGDTNFNLEFCWRDENGSLINTTRLAKPVSPNTQITLNDEITIPARPANAKYGDFKVYCGNNAYSLIYSQPCMRLMMSGSLIVDGAIDGKTIRGAEIIGGEIKSISVNEDGNPVFSLSSDGKIVGGYIDCYGLNVDGEMSAGSLTVENINCSWYPQSMDEDTTVYINSSVTSSTDWVDGAKFSSLEDMYAVMPRNLNGYTLFIIFETDYNGNIHLSRFNSGSCYIYLQKHTIRGYIYVYGQSMRYAIYGNQRGVEGGTENCANIKPPKGKSQSGYAYTIGCDYSSLTCYDLNIYPGVDTTVEPSGIIVTNLSKAYLSNINAVGNPKHLVRSHSSSHVYVAGSSGLTTSNTFSAVSGSLQMLNKTTQAGTTTTISEVYTSGNAQVFKDGVTFTKADNSGTNDSGSSTVETNVVTLKASSGNTFRRTVYNNWKNDGSVRQGDWGYGDCDGFWFFGSQISNYTGKNITKVEITIKRLTGAGNSQAVSHTLVGHNYASKPSGTPSAMGSAIRTFSLSAGSSVTLNLTSSEITTFKKYKGIGLKSPYDSSHYSNCSSACTVKITYTE